MSERITIYGNKVNLTNTMMVLCLKIWKGLSFRTAKRQKVFIQHLLILLWQLQNDRLSNRQCLISQMMKILQRRKQMEKYLKELIDKKGLNEGYKECVHMIESLMHNCHNSDGDKLNKIKKLIEIIAEEELKNMIVGR